MDTRALQELSPGLPGLCKNLLSEQLGEQNVSALEGWSSSGCEFLMKTLGYECVIISLLFLTAWHPVGLRYFNCLQPQLSAASSIYKLHKC